MWVWLDQLGLLLFDATASTALFLSVIMLAMLICRQPARRLIIARVAILSSLLMIPLVAFAPLPRLDLSDAIIQSDLFPALLVVNPDQIKLNSPVSPSSEGLDAGRIPGNRSPSKTTTAAVWLTRSLTLIGLLGVGVGLAWLVLGCVGVRWLIRHSREPSAPTRALYDGLRPGADEGHARAALRVSSRLERPVVVGLFRPTILLPQSMEERQGAEEHLRLTLLHEMAHAEQSDPRFGTMAALAQAVWFFVPQIWWLRSQLLLDQEFMADRLAASHYETRSNYAASLLTLLESRTGHRAEELPARESENFWPTFESPEFRSPLFQRLLMLLHCPYQIEAITPGPWSWTLRLAVMAAAIAASCVFVRLPDLTVQELRLAEMARSKSRSFRVARILSEPFVMSHGSRSVAYLLPLVLPPNFELKVDVQAGEAELSHIRIAGNNLGSSAPSSSPSDAARHFADDSRTWHEVHLVRADGRLSLWIDGQSVPIDQTDEKTNEWLTIEPGPDREVQFRELVFTW